MLERNWPNCEDHCRIGHIIFWSSMCSVVDLFVWSFSFFHSAAAGLRGDPSMPKCIVSFPPANQKCDKNVSMSRNVIIQARYTRVHTARVPSLKVGSVWSFSSLLSLVKHRSAEGRGQQTANVSRHPNVFVTFFWLAFHLGTISLVDVIVTKLQLYIQGEAKNLLMAILVLVI